MTTCRHCHRSGHTIEHCPFIISALVDGAARACRECGAEIAPHGKRIVCPACYASLRRVPGAALQRNPNVRHKTYTVLIAPPGCDFRPGAELLHFESAVSAGIIDSGVLVRTVVHRDGRSRALYYVVERTTLNQIAGPAAYRQRQMSRPR